MSALGKALRVGIVALGALTPAQGHAQAGRSGPETTQRTNQALEQWNEWKQKNPGADQLVREQLADPMGSAIPNVPKTAGRGIVEWIEDKLMDVTTGTV